MVRLILAMSVLVVMFYVGGILERRRKAAAYTPEQVRKALINWYD